MIRPLLVYWLIIYSIRYRTRPWNFFQLNSRYFNRKKNIFSKLDLDNLIPEQYRLHQTVDDGRIKPVFPVFIKPEWGQNSHGVKIVKDLADLEKHRKGRSLSKSSVTYLLQQVAPEKREFEFFYIRAADDLTKCSISTLTETINTSDNTLVVNGVHNRDSKYIDLSGRVGDDGLETLWRLVNNIGCFKIARIGLCADSVEKLLSGEFHIIEMNIFLPMPLLLLDESIDFSTKYLFIKKSMRAAAQLAAQGGLGGSNREPIFFKKLIAHYKVK